MPIKIPFSTLASCVDDTAHPSARPSMVISTKWSMSVVTFVISVAIIIHRRIRRLRTFIPRRHRHRTPTVKWHSLPSLAFRTRVPRTSTIWPTVRYRRWARWRPNSPVDATGKPARFSLPINVVRRSSVARVRSCYTRSSTSRFIPKINWSFRSFSSEQWRRRISPRPLRVSAMSSFVSARTSRMNTCHWKRPPTPSAIPAPMRSSSSLWPSYPCSPPGLWTTKPRSLPTPTITRGNRTRAMLERTQPHTIRLNHPQPIPTPMDKTIPRTPPLSTDERTRVTTEVRRGRQPTRIGTPLPQRWQRRQVLMRTGWQRATQSMAKHRRRWQCIINFINEEDVSVFERNGIEECFSTLFTYVSSVNMTFR